VAMRRKKIGELSTFLMSFLFAFSVCSGIAAAPELKATKESAPIVIGVSNVQSGPFASLGRNLLQGSIAYFDRVNKRGGIHGRKIVVIVKDDKFQQDPTLLNTNELIDKEKVLFLFDYVGSLQLAHALPLLKYYEKEKIVNVAPFTGADPQRRPPYDQFVFNIRASYREEALAVVRYLYAKGYRRIGLFSPANASVLGVTEALAEFHLEVIESTSYRVNLPFEADMSEQVKILRDAGADAVIAFGSYAPCGGFIRDARLAGWNAPIVSLSFVGADVLVGKLREASKKTGRDLMANLVSSQIVPSPEDSNYPLVADYRANIPAAYDGYVALEGWLNAVIVTEALKRAGPSATRASFIHAMESIHDWDPGIGVKLNFSANNHQGMHKVWLIRLEKGRWVPEGTPQDVK